MTDDHASIALLMAELKEALRNLPNDETNLRRALELAAEANLMPRGAHRDEMVREARTLLRQGRRR